MGISICLVNGRELELFSNNYKIDAYSILCNGHTLIFNSGIKIIKGLEHSEYRDKLKENWRQNDWITDIIRSQTPIVIHFIDNTILNCTLKWYSIEKLFADSSEGIAIQKSSIAYIEAL